MLLTKMSCVENIPPVQEAEREEGEIVDDLDDLSDISSEEEYLLRQRLQVLENYNNVLERKKAKKTSVTPGKKRKDIQTDISELSDISCTAIEDDTLAVLPRKKHHKETKTHHRGRRRKAPVQSRPKPIQPTALQPKPTQPNLTKLNLAKQKDTKKKIKPKKKLEPAIVISESSDESDYEYRNKRRKLANAVSIKTKTDTSLKARLMNMLCITRTDEHYFPESKITILSSSSKSNSSETLENIVANSFDIMPAVIDKTKNLEEVIVNTNEVTKVIKKPEGQSTDTVDSRVNLIENAMNVTNVNSINQNLINDAELNDESNDDLEILRQHALNSKTKKQKPDKVKPQEVAKSEDEDSDTAELRLICLRSALLKKAIEMKQKQKLRKRISQSTSLYDEIVEQECMNEQENNNTDTESVDMDIGSDHDNKTENSGLIIETAISIDNKTQKATLKSSEKDKPKLDDLDEDEDLLRAKLLTSLSKNLFVEADNLNVSIEDIKNNEKADIAAKIEETQVPAEKRFIINTADSDSEAEHEATKNLTKMHVKLSDSVEFQQRLDLFLKSTRMEVEKAKLPDVVQKPNTLPEIKTPEKFVPKTVIHLPKSEQMEYKNLVKRMAELEKIKQARQASLPSLIPADIARGPVKPRTIVMQNNRQVSVSNLEDQIALSRKKIAEESSKVLSLKDEGQKMIQRYKIVATELRNLSTAISLNKKEQRSAQMRLSKMRSQHQGLLKRTNFQQSNCINLTPQPKSTSTPNSTKHVQTKPADYKNQTSLKSVKVSVVNDIKEQLNPLLDLSVKLDISSNTKVVSKPREIHSNVTNNKIAQTDGKVQNDKEKCQIVKTAENDKGKCQIVKTAEKDKGKCQSDKTAENEKGKSQINKTAENEKGKSQIDKTAENDKGKCQSNKGKAQNDKVAGERQVVCVKNVNDDYKSPLDALAADDWNEDPNGFLCPFEVGGSCKDAKCKFLHPKRPSH